MQLISQMSAVNHHVLNPDQIKGRHSERDSISVNNFIVGELHAALSRSRGDIPLVPVELLRIYTCYVCVTGKQGRSGESLDGRSLKC